MGHLLAHDAHRPRPLCHVGLISVGFQTCGSLIRNRRSAHYAKRGRRLRRSITAIFGGIELDLTEASIQGSEATLAITAIFGGVEVRVPPNWQVAFRGAPIFGGIEDKTRTSRSGDPANSNIKMLVITGAVIFGGLEIKN
ncbi:MAG: hypothetical protein DMG47_15815 [Acidobacteria bacterium]|nr:MAG: hypothetical protein DMG47_15815 [Acidobacteriota bacterium]